LLDRVRITVTRHTLLGSESTSGDRGSDRPTPDDEARDSGTGVANRQVHATEGARGQTTLDFTVGVSIFLLVLISVFLFIPGTLEPFTQGSQEEIVTVNRLADQLSEGQLGDPATPHQLNTTCTVRFFGVQGRNVNLDCNYRGKNLTERLGMKNYRFVNVSLQRLNQSDSGNTLLCWHRRAGRPNEVVEQGSGNCDLLFAAGGTPPDTSSSSVSARRVVTINGTSATMVVEVW
jgi:hypothetical protein